MLIKQRKALPKEKSNVLLAPLPAYAGDSAARCRKTGPGPYSRGLRKTEWCKRQKASNSKSACKSLEITMIIIFIMRQKCSKTPTFF